MHHAFKIIDMESSLKRWNYEKYKVFANAIIVFSLNIKSQAQTTQIKFGTPGIYPEGVTFSSKNNLFYVSSVTTGTIGSVDMKGSLQTCLPGFYLKINLRIKN